MFGVPAHAGNHRVLDEIKGISGASVLCERIVVIVRIAMLFENDILEDASEADGVVNLRLVFLREPDALGVASALEVEDAVGAPAVLVVTDETPVRVGREGSLAGPRETEKQSADAIRTDIGRAVHGENIALGQQKIEHAKNGFFHLAGVTSAADEHHTRREINNDERFRAGAIAFRIGLKAGRGDDGELRMVRLQLVCAWPHKKLADEEIVPGKL